MYKLILSDMDGTLLDSDKRLTDMAKEAIDDAKKAGIDFALSTGRPEAGVSRFSGQLPLEIPSILYNGVMIRRMSDGEILFRKQLPTEAVSAIIALAKEKKTTYVVWSAGKLFASEINDRVNNYKKISGLEPELIAEDCDFSAEGVEKILWIDEPEKCKAWQDEINRSIPGASAATSNPRFLEFYSDEVSKGVATVKMCELLGIDVSECVGVGDGMNDVEMIKTAGLGVAMKNSPDEVKACADMVTDYTCDEDGIAHLIYKIIEMNKV